MIPIVLASVVHSPRELRDPRDQIGRPDHSNFGGCQDQNGHFPVAGMLDQQTARRGQGRVRDAPRVRLHQGLDLMKNSSRSSILAAAAAAAAAAAVGVRMIVVFFTVRSKLVLLLAKPDRKKQGTDGVLRAPVFLGRHLVHRGNVAC